MTKKVSKIRRMDFVWSIVNLFKPFQSSLKELDILCRSLNVLNFLIILDSNVLSIVLIFLRVITGKYLRNYMQYTASKTYGRGLLLKIKQPMLI